MSDQQNKLWTEAVSRRKVLASLGAIGVGMIAGVTLLKDRKTDVSAASTTVESSAMPAVVPFREKGVSVTEYGAKGNGVSDDRTSIIEALEKEHSIYFPKGVYGLSGTLRLTKIKNKTLTFHPEAKLLHLAGASNAIVSMLDCSQLSFTNLQTDSLSKDTTNAVVVNSCDHLEFNGLTKVGLSNSLAFVLRGGSHSITLETLIVDDPRTRDGLSLMNCHDVTIGTVIGRNNSDDLVVVKAYTEEKGVDASTYNIQIGSIHAMGCYGAFTIGSEVYDGDIYNISVGEIVAHGTRRGLYFKMWDATKDGIPNSRRGEVYQIHVGCLLLHTTKAGRGLTPIDFDVQHDDFLNRYHDITIEFASIRGAFATEFVHIQRSTRIHIRHLETVNEFDPQENRSDLNLRAVRMRDHTTDCYIGGGFLQSTETPVRIENLSNGNTIQYIQPTVRNRKGNVPESANLIMINNSEDNRILQCDLRTALAQPIKLSGSANSTTLLEGNLGRNGRRSAPPAKGYWYVGEKIEVAKPTVGGFIGWICVRDGSPGVWRSYGKIE